MNMTKKHLLIMLACCLIPLVALGAIFIFKVPANGAVYFGIMLLCPALHLIMMKSMMGNEHAGHDPAGGETPLPKAKTPARLPTGEKTD